MLRSGNALDAPVGPDLGTSFVSAYAHTALRTSPMDRPPARRLIGLGRGGGSDRQARGRADLCAELNRAIAREPEAQRRCGADADGAEQAARRVELSDRLDIACRVEFRDLVVFGVLEAIEHVMSDALGADREAQARLESCLREQ